MTAAYQLPYFKNIAAGTAGLLLALSFFFAAAPSAYAESYACSYSSGLTCSQADAIINLLASFDTDPATIDQIGAILRGSSGCNFDCGLPHSGPYVEFGSSSEEKDAANYIGTYRISFDVGALDDDIYLDRSITRADWGWTYGDGFVWSAIDTKFGNELIAAVITAGDSESGDTPRYFKVSEGEDRGFTLTVSLSVAPGGRAGVKINAINWTTDPNDPSAENFLTVLPDLNTNALSFESEKGGVYFSTIPESGQAPLTVEFVTSATSDDGNVTIDFGDKGGGGLQWFDKGLSYTYVSSGTYFAKLYRCHSNVLSQCGYSDFIAGQTITVTTADVPAPTCSVGASPSSITAGQSTTVTWSSSNATSVSGPAPDISNLNSSRAFTPTQSTSYGFTFSGPGGKATCSATVTVSPAVAELPGPYTFSQGFSTQHTALWDYGQATGSGFPRMNWVSADNSWEGTEEGGYPRISKGGAHPGASSDAAFFWHAPKTGKVSITGTVFDSDSNCGDGIQAGILQNNVGSLWSGSVANGDTSGKSHNISTTISAGDWIAFIVNRNGGYHCDSTSWNPTVTYTSLSAASPSAVAVAPTCPPLPPGSEVVSGTNADGSCSISTTTGSGLTASLGMLGVPDYAGFMAAAAMSPWYAAVDSLADIFYSIGLY